MTDDLLQLLSRIGATALARAAVGFLICLGLAFVSRRATAGILTAFTVAYSVLGTLALSRAVKAERKEDLDEAAGLYVLALVNYAVSYASVGGFFVARFYPATLVIGM